MSDTNPTKRKRTCTQKVAKKTDTQYTCGLLLEIQDLLIKYDGKLVDALNVAVANFIHEYHNHKEEEEESEGEEVKEDHSWSDSCSEHTSDREFVTEDDGYGEDGDYEPSSSEEEEEEEED